MPQGTVKWFDGKKGYGFITPDDGDKDIFVHFSEIQGAKGFKTLAENDAVEFEIGSTAKGKCAKQVRKI